MLLTRCDKYGNRIARNWIPAWRRFALFIMWWGPTTVIHLRLELQHVKIVIYHWYISTVVVKTIDSVCVTCGDIRYQSE